MSRGGEDVYETSTHKKHVIPMVYIKKEADWKAWRSGLAVAAKIVGLPHVLMSMAVDRDKVEQLKPKTVSKLKKKKKKSILAKKAESGCYTYETGCQEGTVGRGDEGRNTGTTV